MQAERSEFDPPKSCKKPEAVVCICSLSTPNVRWEAETGQAPRNLEVSHPGVYSVEH